MHFPGPGMMLEDLLPLQWSPGPLPEGVVLARLNADNHQLLGAVASLDEVRVNDALKDESPALVHELQRLEFKLNVLLRLTAELAKRSSNYPAPQHVKLGATGIEWLAADTPSVGSTGIVDLYINSSLPQPLRLPVTVIGVSQMQYSGLSESVIESLEKLIFRHHRRLVASTRSASKTAG